MLKLIVFLAVALSLSLPAHAGFVTGVVVGSMASSVSSSPASGNSLYSSNTPRRNVIVCCTSRITDFLMCETFHGNFSPAQFTKTAGYSYLYSRGFTKTATGCDMIVMEVGNQ